MTPGPPASPLRPHRSWGWGFPSCPRDCVPCPSAWCIKAARVTSEGTRVGVPAHILMTLPEEGTESPSLFWPRSSCRDPAGSPTLRGRGKVPRPSGPLCGEAHTGAPACPYVNPQGLGPLFLPCPKDLLVITGVNPALPGGIGLCPEIEIRPSTGPRSPGVWGWADRAPEMGDKRLLEPEGPGGGLSRRQGTGSGGLSLCLKNSQKTGRRRESQKAGGPPDTASLQGRNCSAGAKQALRSTTTSSMAAPDGSASVLFPPFRSSQIKKALTGTLDYHFHHNDIRI